jgi:hypothetical protein
MDGVSQHISYYMRICQYLIHNTPSRPAASTGHKKIRRYVNWVTVGRRLIAENYPRGFADIGDLQ